MVWLTPSFALSCLLSKQFFLTVINRMILVTNWRHQNFELLFLKTLNAIEQKKTLRLLCEVACWCLYNHYWSLQSWNQCYDQASCTTHVVCVKFIFMVANPLQSTTNDRNAFNLNSFARNLLREATKNLFVSPLQERRSKDCSAKRLFNYSAAYWTVKAS